MGLILPRSEALRLSCGFALAHQSLGCNTLSSKYRIITTQRRKSCPSDINSHRDPHSKIFIVWKQCTYVLAEEWSGRYCIRSSKHSDRMTRPAEPVSSPLHRFLTLPPFPISSSGGVTNLLKYEYIRTETRYFHQLDSWTFCGSVKEEVRSSNTISIENTEADVSTQQDLEPKPNITLNVAWSPATCR